MECFHAGNGQMCPPDTKATVRVAGMKGQIEKGLPLCNSCLITTVQEMGKKYPTHPVLVRAM